MANIDFRDFDVNITWDDFHNLFSKFGKIKKLYLHPSGNFGKVYFFSEKHCQEAYATCNKVPPLYLSLKYNAADKFNEDSSIMNNSEIMGDLEMQKLDIHGNPVDVYLDDTDTEYVPLYQVKRTGFHLFDPQNFNERLISNEQILKEFNLYMLAKAKKFMLEHHHCLPDKAIQDAIERCREKIFLEATEPTNTGQAPSLRKPRQKPEINGTRSSIRSISPAGRTPPLLTRTVTVKHDSKKETRRSREDKTPRYVQLQKDVFQEVIITHVVNDCSYFVTLAANSEEVQRIAYQTNCTAVNGTATEPYVGNIYGAKLGGIWARAAILATRPTLRALFVDSGVRATITEVRTLPYEVRSVLRQAVNIKLSCDQYRTFQVGDRLQVKPTLFADDSYLVEVKTNKAEQRAQPRKVEQYKNIDEKYSKFGQLQPARNTSFSDSRASSQTNSNIKTPRSKASVSPVKHTSSSPSVSPTKQARSSPSLSPVKQTRASPSLSPVKQPGPSSSVLSHKGTSSRQSVAEQIGTEGNLTCTDFYSDDSFVAYMLTNKFYDELVTLVELPNDLTPDENYRPEIGDTVAIEKKDDDTWARAIVINKEQNKYICALVDFGIVATAEEVRRLPDKYKDIIEFSCMCTTDKQTVSLLKGIDVNVPVTVTAVNAFSLEVNGSEYAVIAKRWDPFVTSPLAVKKDEKKPVFLDVPPSPALNDDDVIKMIAEYEQRILVRTRQSQETLVKVAHYIEQFKAEKLDSPPLVGQLVLSPCEGESGLYRGVVKSLQGQSALIYFLDYGNEDLVKIELLHNVDETLATFSCTCIKTPPLKDVNELSANALLFLEAHRDKKYKVVFSDDKSQIDFKDLKDETLLSDVLISLDAKPKETPQVEPVLSPKPSTSALEEEQGTNASPVSKPPSEFLKYNELPSLDIKPGQHTLLCIYKEDLNDGFVTFISADESTHSALDKISEDIKNYVEKDTEIYRPQKLELCIAKYEGEWYRGTVMHIDEKYTIYFFDYGNTSDVDPEDIRKFPESLATVPGLAMMCILNGLPNTEEGISDDLYKELDKLIEENTPYEVEILSVGDAVYYVNIPSVYDKLKNI